MTAQPFRADTVVREGRATIALHGDLDGSADADLTAAYDRAKAAGMTELVLDFASAAYINSTGIAVLVRILAAGRRDRIAIRARGLSPHYVEIFEITRIADFMSIEREAAATTGGIA
jgi:anti-anti-sigma factor